MKYLLFLFFTFFLVTSGAAQESWTVVSSDKLVGEIEVLVYDSRPTTKDKPIIYFTDGAKMVDNGTLLEIKRLTEDSKIKPAYYVFVSSRDPMTGKDHRNTYFFSNPDYLSFFEEELIPKVEKKIGACFKTQDRALAGISFGGLNGAYFSAKSTKFGAYGLLSPVTYPRTSVIQDISFSKNKDLRIFLSTGTNDAENYLPTLENSYKSKGYKVEVLKTDGGHDFKNWNGQLEIMLSFLWGKVGRIE
ncbi:MAG: alpha/beta hydrolase-fold protein [Saonia sp.]